MLENFGDAPFLKDQVGPETIAAITRLAARIRAALPSPSLGVNVLRNDARVSIATAATVGGDFGRVNLHVGAKGHRPGDHRGPGTALKVDSRTTAPLDPERASRFVDAARR